MRHDVDRRFPGREASCQGREGAHAGLMPIPPDPAPAAGESAAHRELKALTLGWAQANDFRIAAAEVSLPSYRVRMDVAGYRLQRTSEVVWDERRQKHRRRIRPSVGITAAFECKVSKSDFRRDARSEQVALDRLRVLHEKKARVEEEMRIFYPSIRNGDSLFAEYETLNFERPGYERYLEVLAEISQLTARLYENTKFDRFLKVAAANLHYVVAEAGVVAPHELPAGWGLLLRQGDVLVTAVKPTWQEVSEDVRFEFLLRIAQAGTRAENFRHGVVRPAREDERRARAVEAVRVALAGKAVPGA